MDYLHQFGLAFMAFFAIMNPVSSLPVYISLTAGDDEATAKAVARKGLLIAFGIIVVFALGGRYIFEMFGMTLPALRLAGGALVFLIGFHMLQGQHSAVHHPPAGEAAACGDKLGVAVSPLATPLLASALLSSPSDRACARVVARAISAAKLQAWNWRRCMECSLKKKRETPPSVPRATVGL